MPSGSWPSIGLGVVCGVAVALAIGVVAQFVRATQPGLAIEGYDPVAYFTDGEPRRGSPEWSYVWEGVRWRFADATHLALFAADPEAYRPRYYRFCALAPPLGPLDDIDPEAWTIVNGELRLNDPRFGRSGEPRQVLAPPIPDAPPG